MLMNTETLKKTFAGTELEETANMIADTDLFHALIQGDTVCALAAAKALKNPPKDYLKWVKVCKGGLLYDIRMLSQNGEDDDVSYGSFEEYGAIARDAGVPEDYLVFAAMDTGDLYCFRYDTAACGCGANVYHWDGEASEWGLVWDSFNAWLAEQVLNAMDMIAEGDLEPVPFKAEEES